ncbi:hypothetical protein XarjCFBP7653_12480 [Xanthomonas arboricola]|nr:hypothetical protein XarjCFBP7653_12480 [Xanthomonas arboricola]
MKPQNPAAGFGQGGSAAGNRLLGSADILSDSPPRHIRVQLSANPRPRCRSARCFHDLKRSRRNSMTLLSTSPQGRGGTAGRACLGAPAPQARAGARSGGGLGYSRRQPSTLERQAGR